jgi:hypothetical protein
MRENTTCTQFPLLFKFPDVKSRCLPLQIIEINPVDRGKRQELKKIS